MPLLSCLLLALKSYNNMLLFFFKIWNIIINAILIGMGGWYAVQNSVCMVLDTGLLHSIPLANHTMPMILKP